MYIKKIAVKKFRHLENVVLGPYLLPPQQGDLVVLAGPNGGGKSSILELLGLALSNSWSLTWALQRTMPQSSFEIELGVSPLEIDLLRNDPSASSWRPQLAKLEASRSYFRAFNFPDGEYARDQNLNNVIHNQVAHVLRNTLKRSLGFFLRSDREYPKKAFNRNKLFDYGSMGSKDHLWSLAYNASDVQYQDMFDYLVQQRFHYFRALGQHHHAQLSTDAGKGTSTSPPTDPLLPYDALLQRLFPGYRFADSAEEIPTNLFVRLPNGAVIPFFDLSSGEREVFFIISFFLRHDVSNAVIVLDEPELHLHPELGRKLIRTMRSVQPGNQIWVATHNPEIVDEAGRDRTTYIAKDPTTGLASATRGDEEPGATAALRNLFGYSGYIGIARRMVFLEGTELSHDRKVLTSLFPQHAASIRFVPSGGNGSFGRLNSAIMSILSATFAECEFYLVRDRDYLTEAMARRYAAQVSGRMHVLARNQIENYMLDAETIATVQTEIFANTTTPAAVDETLKRVAEGIAGEVLRDMVSFRLNAATGPQDFSLGRYFEGISVLDDAHQWKAAEVAAFAGQLRTKAAGVASGIATAVTEERLNQITSDCMLEITAALDGDGWRVLFPGKRLLEEYARRCALGRSLAFANSIVKELGDHPDRIPVELTTAIDVIVRGGRFGTTSPPGQAERSLG